MHPLAHKARWKEKKKNHAAKKPKLLFSYGRKARGDPKKREYYRSKMNEQKQIKKSGRGGKKKNNGDRKFVAKTATFPPRYDSGSEIKAG